MVRLPPAVRKVLVAEGSATRSLDPFSGDHGAILGKPRIGGGQDLGHDLFRLLRLFVAFAFFLGHLRDPLCRVSTRPMPGDRCPRSGASGAARSAAEVGACGKKMGVRAGEGKGVRGGGPQARENSPVDPSSGKRSPGSFSDPRRSAPNARSASGGPGCRCSRHLFRPGCSRATIGCKADRDRTDGALGVRPSSRPPRGGGSGAVRFALGKSDGVRVFG